MNKIPHAPYSIKEASNYGEGFPDRGIQCKKCGTNIPLMEGFGEIEKAKWKSILESQGFEKADEYIISITGCNERWAKIWRLHPDGPILKESKYSEGTACPNCGKELRTKKAKQCPHCFSNWRA